MTKKNLVFISMTISGVLIPILPRLIFPTSFLRKIKYLDRIYFPWEEPFIFIWTTIPFFSLALIAHFRLRRNFDGVYHYISWVSGIAGAYLSTFIMGFIIHIPRGGGANFGVFFFPFWAGMSMPIAYSLGWTIGGYSYRLYLYLKKPNRTEADWSDEASQKPD